MMSSEEDNPYAVLGLLPEASFREVKSSFRRLAKRFHPDLHAGDAWHQEQFRRIHTAYEVIESAHKAASRRSLRETSTGFAEASASPPNTFPATWVHVGEVTNADRLSFNSEAFSQTTRRHRAGRHIRRTSAALLVTGGLAVATLFLLVMAFVSPHSSEASVASGIAQGSATSLATPGILPPLTTFPANDMSGEAGQQDGTPAYSVSGEVSKSPLLEHRGNYSSIVSTSTSVTGVPHTEFSVDDKYTRIDPTYTAIDSRYTTVNVDGMGAGSQEMGVDSKYTSIDSKLTQP